MTKEEKIKEAWGQDYSKAVREDGWSTIKPLNIDLFDVKTEICRDVYPNDSERKIYRPKSLQGVEHNNGWVKLESEDDLPKNEDGLYSLTHIDKDGYLPAESYYILEKFWRSGTITHYQPIEKRQPPIY